MKRYIRASMFSETISKISYIYYVDDIDLADCQSTVAASILCNEDDQEVSDINDLALSDFELRSLPVDYIQKIQNLELIGRIGHLGEDMYRKLTQDQRIQFARWAKVTERLDEEDIKHFLEMIRGCTSVHQAFPMRKNRDFLAKHPLSESEILEVLKSLQPSECVKSTTSYDRRTFNDTYLIFRKPGIKLSSGVDISDLLIYVKLDVDLSNHSTVVYVSFHEWVD